MEYDWASSTGVTPPFDVKYKCIWAGKKIVKNSDLAQGLEDSVVDDITISCQDNGTYDQAIEDYTCTRVCPFPTNPDTGKKNS